MKCNVIGCGVAFNSNELALYCPRCTEEMIALRQVKHSPVKEFAFKALLLTIGLTICLGGFWLIIRFNGGKP